VEPVLLGVILVAGLKREEQKTRVVQLPVSGIGLQDGSQPEHQATRTQTMPQRYPSTYNDCRIPATDCSMDKFVH
jgi:hypothetical protein